MEENQTAPKTWKTLDANEAVARVAYHCSETIAIYPITPSSPMAEYADEWQNQGRLNLWKNLPSITEMQSEGGAIGAVHGMLQAGTMATTFTASQGLLLMIPNLYKIAGELTPFVAHVTARTLATHALSIFGDHSDVMACRATGMAMLCSGSVQEAQDFACIAHTATLRSRIPFLHFFDGFRTSHEISKIEILPESVIERLYDKRSVAAHRHRAMTPDRPTIRGTAQNPDVFFQARERSNPYYSKLPQIIASVFEAFEEETGRRYDLFDYYGHPEAERVIVLMGSGAEIAHEYIDWALERGDKVGLVKVRLYRPFSVPDFINALPATTKKIAVLDRTKEPGAIGDPLYLDIVTAFLEASTGGLWTNPIPRIIGGRYGLSSKEFTPAMVHAVFAELDNARPKNHFTVGIDDDVSGTSIPVEQGFDIEPENVRRAIFFGLGSDGTVGANKNSIKIIGEETDNFAQGYFVYDSKKSGSITTSHLRFGPKPIRSSYLISKANFVAVHHFTFLEKQNILQYAVENATVLINTPHAPDRVWRFLPANARHEIVSKNLRCYVIDASKVALDTGMGGRVNTIMQTCFFALSGVLDREEAIARIKYSIEKTYARKGADVVQKNFAAVDHTLAHLKEMVIGSEEEEAPPIVPVVPDEAPGFVRRITAKMLAQEGDSLPVSAFPPDGIWPTSTSRWEKRNIAATIPAWDSSLCIQCNKCVFVCPHAAIRSKYYDPNLLNQAPPTFKSTKFRSTEFANYSFTLQVAAEDCTGCSLCVSVCPARDKADPKRKAINMEPQPPLRDAERENYNFFLNLPEPDRSRLKPEVKSTQFYQPLFEYSGACAGCGETPYIKLLTQLFGDRLLIANATGCSSIYGGNLPTTPYCTNNDGRGPAWANSLFEDNAEFGLGIRLAVDHHVTHARRLLSELAPQVGDTLTKDILDSLQDSESEISAQRGRVATLRQKLSSLNTTDARWLESYANYLVKKSVWIIGGDGWSYDIGYGGVDHVLSGGHDINILVLDTQVYSNTGGQSSKSTPQSAIAKFAAAGKSGPRKDLGLIAMNYGHVYVASVAMGARDNQTVAAFVEAESFQGPSLILAYSHCIAHGFRLNLGLEQQKLAVDSGFWPLYRHDPRRRDKGEAALKLDSPAPKVPLSRFSDNETRFRILERINPGRARDLGAAAQQEVKDRHALLEVLATNRPAPVAEEPPAAQ